MKHIKTILAVFAFIVAGTGLAAAIELMPMNDIKVGMRGTGRTVITGRRIETFEVEVLGILANNKVNDNLLINGKSILVKVSGDVISRAGGIAAGMSGSPVYIDGKLAGGISSGWVMTDHTVGLVTPIEEMLEIWDYPQRASADNIKPVEWILSEPVELAGKTVNKIRQIPWYMTDELQIEDDEALFRMAAAEVHVTGLGAPAARHLGDKLGRRNIKMVYESAVDSDGFQPIEEFEVAADVYEPGSAVGVQLARGDINMTTLGTLTHRDGHRILALAHPFLKKGNVSFLMTGAYIYHSFSSVQMPFKIGAPTEMIGIITQDREKGLSGEIGRFPQMVPIQIDVTDKDLNLTQSINYQVVRDPSVFGMVLESTLLQALEGVIDREGAGTALMGISVDCSNADGEQYSFRRENLFYSRSDIVQSLITEVGNLMGMIVESEIEEVMPTRLVIKLEIEKRRRTVSIEKVDIKNVAISGGGTLNAEITLKPFRQKSFIRKVNIPIPQDIGQDNLTLSVFGLNMRLEDTDMGTDSREKLREIRGESPVITDFDAAIRSWASAPKNSDLLFQLTVDGEEVRRIRISDRDYEIQPTNHVVLGRVDTTLTLSED